MPYSTKTLVLSKSNNISTLKNQLNVVLPTVFYAENSEVALANMYIYFSWFNITKKFNNTTYAYIWNGVSYPVIMPDGFYSPTDMSGYLNYVMITNGHYLVNAAGVNQYYLKIVENAVYYADSIVATPIPSFLPLGWSNPNSVVLSGQTPQLTIPNNNSFGLLIGFAAGNYPAIPTTVSYSVNSTFTPEVSPITSINVVTNIANSGDFNSIPGIIATFSSGNTSFGGQIIIDHPYPMFYPVVDGRIPNISISLFDDQNRPLEANDPNIIATLNIRTSKK